MKWPKASITVLAGFLSLTSAAVQADVFSMDPGLTSLEFVTVGVPYVYSAKGGDANWDNRPVSYVSFWDAARFCNWLHNGQGDGDTESGAAHPASETESIGFRIAGVPEPGSITLLVCGAVAGLIWWRRRLYSSRSA